MESNTKRDDLTESVRHLLTHYKSNKNITRVVKRVLHNQIENKQSYALDNFEITPNMEAINCFKCIPLVIQGVKQGQRIGNRIKVISLKLGVSLTMLSLPYSL